MEVEVEVEFSAGPPGVTVLSVLDGVGVRVGDLVVC